jgi:hypothetical protein
MDVTLRHHRREHQVVILLSDWCVDFGRSSKVRVTPLQFLFRLFRSVHEGSGLSRGRLAMQIGAAHLDFLRRTITSTGIARIRKSAVQRRADAVQRERRELGHGGCTLRILELNATSVLLSVNIVFVLSSALYGTEGAGVG